MIKISAYLCHPTWKNITCCNEEIPVAGKRAASFQTCAVSNALSNALCPGAGARASSCCSKTYLEAECQADWTAQLPHSFQKVIVRVTVHCSICCKWQV